MKLCLACNAEYSASRRDCSNCGAVPAVVDGFEAYAPDLAHGGTGFKAGYFSKLAPLEAANFWFRARNRIIVWALEEYASSIGSFLEIGCGTGFVLTGIARRFPDLRICGSEIFAEGLRFAAKRLSSAEFMQMDARQIPFANEFDAVGAFDVLEHIEEDEIVLGQIHNALRSDGIMLLTVPQHKWLWSATDEYACHERRYAAGEIRDKVKSAGFSIVRSTSFVTTLLPAMMIARMFQKGVGEGFDPAAELKMNPAFNSILETVLNLEISGIKLGISYPFGGSRLVIARKA